MSGIRLRKSSITFSDEAEKVKIADIDLNAIYDNLPKDINEISTCQSMAIFSNVVGNLIELNANGDLLQNFDQLNSDLNMLIEEELFDSDMSTSNSNLSMSNSGYVSTSLVNIPSPLSEMETSRESLNDIGDQPVIDDHSIEFQETTPEYEKESAISDDEDVDVTSTSPEQVAVSVDNQIDGFQNRLARLRQEKRLSLLKKDQNNLLIKRFYLKSKPSLSVAQFLERIEQYCSLSTSVYLTCSYYLFKLSYRLKIFPITELNIYRLILASIRVSCKLVEDINYKQKHFATVGGINQEELFRIEVGFLFIADFNLIISEAILEQHLADAKILNDFVKSHSTD